MKQFAVKILGITAILFILGWLVFSLFLSEYYLPVLSFMLLFFMIITLLIHAWQLRMGKKDIAKFTRSSMLITFLKLVIYSIFAVVYIALDRENVLVFVICLIVVYAIFSAVEVIEMTRITKNSRN